MLKRFRKNTIQNIVKYLVAYELNALHLSKALSLYAF